MMYLRLTFILVLSFFHALVTAVTPHSLTQTERKKTTQINTIKLVKGKSFRKKVALKGYLKKGIIFFVATLGLVALIGGGVWLYYYNTPDTTLPDKPTVINLPEDLYDATSIQTLANPNQILFGSSNCYYLYDTKKKDKVSIPLSNSRRLSSSKRFLLLLNQQQNKALSLYDSQKKRVAENIETGISLIKCKFSSKDKFIGLVTSNKSRQLTLYETASLFSAEKKIILKQKNMQRFGFSSNERFFWVISKDKANSNSPEIDLYDLESESNASIHNMKATDATFTKNNTCLLIQNDLEKIWHIYDFDERDLLNLAYLDEKTGIDYALECKMLMMSDDEEYILVEEEEYKKTIFQWFSLKQAEYLHSFEIHNSQNVEKSLIGHKLLLNYQKSSGQKVFMAKDMQKEKILFKYEYKDNDSYMHSLGKNFNYLFIRHEENNKILFTYYDLVNEKEIGIIKVPKGYSHNESELNQAEVVQFLIFSKKNQGEEKKEDLLIYEIHHNTLILEKSDVVAFEGYIQDDGSQMLLVFTTEGTLETYNLTQLSSALTTRSKA